MLVVVIFPLRMKHDMKLDKIRLSNSGPVLNTDCRLAALPTRTLPLMSSGYPGVASYTVLGEELYFSNPLKRGGAIYVRLYQKNLYD